MTIKTALWIWSSPNATRETMLVIYITAWDWLISLFQLLVQLLQVSIPSAIVYLKIVSVFVGQALPLNSLKERFLVNVFLCGRPCQIQPVQTIDKKLF